MSVSDAVPVLAVAVLVVLTTGCLTVPSVDETPSPAELEAEISAAEPPRMAAATLESTYATANGTTTSTEDIWMHADGRTAVETTTDGGARFTNVDDGEYAWFYDHESNRVTVLDSHQTGKSHFEYLYSEQQRYFEKFDVTGIREATVGGRETYHVTFEPPQDEQPDRSITVLVGDTEYVVPFPSEDETDDANATPERNGVEQIDVWIDQETLFPVKQEVRNRNGGGGSWTYLNLSFGDAIDDERFEFEPPADATLEKDVHPFGTPSETVADAAAAANVAVTEPTWLPDGVERERIEVGEYFFEDAREVSVRYTAADGRTIVLAVSSGPRPYDYETDGESVTIGDQSGTQVESRFGTQLAWTCAGQDYYLFGTDEFEPETVRDVARSIDCS